ncbi:MAG: hypothetical protein ACLKAK_08745 [Alkaliphilus sp.]
MKKTIIYLSVAILLLAQGFSFDFVQATNTDIQIVSFTTSEDPIKEDDVFNLHLIIKNNSGADISSMDIIIDSNSDFFREGAGATVSGPGSLENGAQTTVSISSLKRKSSGNRMVLEFQYTKDGESLTSVQTIFLNVTEEGQAAPSRPTDTTRFDPRIGLADGFRRPTLRAGRRSTLKLPINTNTNHSARDVAVSLEFDDRLAKHATIDQIIAQVNLDRLSSNKTEDISFTLDISPVIEEGLYQITIKYEYLNSFRNSFTRTETIHVKVTNDQTLPNIVVNRVGITNEIIHQGDVVNFFIDLKNGGSLLAKDVVVTVSGLSDQLSIFNATNVETVENIKGGRVERAHYRLIVSENAKSSNQQFSIKIEYKDEEGNKYELENNAFIFLDVKGGALKTSEIVIENIIVPTRAVSVNEDFLVSFDLKNNSNSDVKNIRVTADGGGDIIPKSLSTISVNLLRAGESKNVYFRLSALDNAITKNYRIALNLEFEKQPDGGKTKQDITEFVGVNIVNDKASRMRTVPKIIIDEFSFGAESIKAGEEFELVISFFNTNNTLEARNIKATVVSSDGSFSPLRGSNMFFIDSIPANDRVKKSITLFPKVDLLTKSYPIIVKLEYEDEKGIAQNEEGIIQQHTADLEINLPVVQEPRLKIDNISIPTEAGIGAPVKIYADFYNMGRGTLNNLIVKAEGNFDGAQLSFFVGNFAAGGSDFFEVSIFPNEIGELKGSIVFSFEDDMGRQNEIREDFSITIVENIKGGEFPLEGREMEMHEKGEMGFDMEDPMNQPRKAGAIWVIVVLSVIALGGITIFIIKSRKKRRALEEGMMTDE